MENKYCPNCNQMVGTKKGSGGLIKAGAGTLDIQEYNLSSGAVRVDAGTLSVANGDYLGIGAISLADGTTLAVSGTTTLGNAITLAGSATIGRYCLIGGSAGILGHLTIADRVTVTAMSLVTHSIREAGEYSSGTPIQSNRQWRRNAARFKHLDEIVRRLGAAGKEPSHE